MTTESFDHYGKLHKLLPCPFCGGPAKFLEYRTLFVGHVNHSVACMRCLSSPFAFQKAASDAALLWNTRAKPEEL